MSNPRMPHVFVIPPEEEHSQNPPWCCFDADLPPENSASIEVNDVLLDVPFLLHQSESSPPLLFDQPGEGPLVTSTPLSKSSSSRAEKRHRPQDVNTSAMHHQVRIVRHDVREDSDVIEVVKVKRIIDHKSDHVPPSPSNPEPQLKRTKTLRARASRALKSIKNVSLSRGKQTNGKPHVKELWTSSESMPGIFRGVLHSQEQFPMPHRKLSGFFHKQPPAEPLQASDARPSISDIRPSYEFIERPNTPCAPTYDHSLRRPVSSSDFQCPPSPSPDSKSSKDLKRHVSPQEIQRTDNDSRGPVSSLDFRQDERPVSPSSTTTSRKGFSLHELHRMFSFAPEPPSSTSAPTSSSKSTSSTHSYPDVPYAAVHLVDDDYGKEIEGKYGRSFDRSLDLHDGGDDQLRPKDTDVNFEMRLDSLHFESLSFDPENFDVSMSLGTTGLAASRR